MPLLWNLLKRSSRIPGLSPSHRTPICSRTDLPLQASLLLRIYMYVYIYIYYIYVCVCIYIYIYIYIYKSCIALKTLNYGNYGICLIVGNAELISATVLWLLYIHFLKKARSFGPQVVPGSRKSYDGVPSGNHHGNLSHFCVSLYSFFCKRPYRLMDL